MLRMDLLRGAMHGSPLLLAITLALSCMHNRPDPPDVPVGPASVEVNREYSFRTWWVGQDSGPGHLRFDWGDGEMSPWVFGGDTAECGHVWSRCGIYSVRAQSHDNRSELSEWSDPFKVTVALPAYPYKRTDSVTLSDGLPWDALVLPQGDFVYATFEDNGLMAVVRTSDMRRIGEIPFADGPSYGQLACSSDGQYIYCTRFRRGGVGVVRTADCAVVDSLMLGSEATSIAVAPDGRRLYVTAQADGCFIVAVKLPEHIVEDTVCALGRRYVTSLTVAPDGSRLYAVEQHDDQRHVMAVRLSDKSVEWRVSAGAGEGPGRIVLNPTGSYLYAAEEEGVLVLETGAGVAVDSVPLQECWNEAMSSDGSFVYVACSDTAGKGAVAVVRASDRQVVRVIQMPDGIEALDVAPSADGENLYVAAADGSLYVYGR
jgi:DNA-binding beta-propeller fold protein YncE